MVDGLACVQLVTITHLFGYYMVTMMGKPHNICIMLLMTSVQWAQLTNQDLIDGQHVIVVIYYVKFCF